MTLCARCSTALPHQSSEIATRRCARCGAVHYADGEVISPLMTGIPVGAADSEWRASPWQFPTTRPVEPGYYECKFASGVRMLLWWTRATFTVSQHDARRVRCATLTTWRGQWAK